MSSKTDYDFGHEGQDVEFKTSFVVSAGEINKDQNYVVFKAVCAIANREGGVLYIGVKDDGSVAKGPHYGVRGDRERLHITNNDALSRHINQKIDSYFFEPKYVHTLVDVEEYNEDVIIIRIRKAEKIIYIHEKGSTERLAFRREGASCVRMDKDAINGRKEELANDRAKKREMRKEDEMRLTIQKAITQKCKIILYGYCSCHGDTKEDRIIEPIEFICDERSVWGYEEKNEGNDPLRQFRLGRAENVGILEEEWNHEFLHLPANVDAFEWSKPTSPSIHISIIIGPAAKNRLVESTPEARKHLIDNGDGQWTLDTYVHDLDPVRDFCSEFKDSINVFVPDELKEMLGITVQPQTHEETTENVVAENNERETLTLLGRITSLFVNFVEIKKQLFSNKVKELLAISEVRY